MLLGNMSTDYFLSRAGERIGGIVCGRRMDLLP